MLEPLQQRRHDSRETGAAGPRNDSDGFESRLKWHGLERFYRRRFYSVKKILLIAFRAGKGGGGDAQVQQGARFRGQANGGDGFFVERGVADDAAAADLLTLEFKLRFEQDEQMRAGSGAAEGGGKNLGDGDEGDIDGD